MEHYNFPFGTLSRNNKTYTSFVILAFGLLDNIDIRLHVNASKAVNMSMLSSQSKANVTFEQNIQIRIALLVDKVHIVINILTENHMAFDLGDKITNITLISLFYLNKILDYYTFVKTFIAISFSVEWVKKKEYGKNVSLLFPSFSV